ncbi:MAG TPA: aldo/keto reductase [Candidatus Krumholzibacterium sp.]|nr:aldo/keto reductase [Candidatus Krumholzibacterium sp.]
MDKKTRRSRREFLKAGLVGAAGMAVYSCASSGESGEESAAKKEGAKIVTRRLGRTGLELPVVSIGTGDTTDAGLVRAALEGGVKLLATSEYYQKGNNERMVAEVVRERGAGSAVVMTSTNPEGFDRRAGVFRQDAAVGTFIKRAEGCLERLGVECVDIMLLPFMAKTESVMFEPYLRAMEDFKKAGKAKFVGIATHSYEHEAIRAAVDSGVYDVAMVAYNFRKENAAEIEEAMAYAAGKGLGIIAMKTMAGNFWDDEQKQPINSTAALKWVLRNENVHTTVPGVTTYDQLRSDLAVMADLKLSEQEKTDLKLGLHTDPDGPYCQQCGRCVPQCAKGLDIPTIMRSHMYAYGYRNLVHARETLSGACGGTDPCAGCGSCGVSCAMGSDVRRKIGKIARLNAVPEEFLA